MTRRVRLAAALAGSLALGAAGIAAAGGLARPVAGSPTAAGLAGAFTAVADDPYALYANPAGLGLAPPGVLASLEFVVAPRSYVPIDADGNRGASQDATAVAPAPVLGASFKPGGPASDVTVGIGAWNSFGGILHWEKGDPDVAAIDASTEVVFEVGAGVGWRVNDRVSLGAALRVGFGLFAVEATKKPVNSDLSGFGVGIGASAGVMIRATDRLTLGAAWRSSLDVATSGDGQLETSPGRFEDVEFEHTQRWPQSASIAAAMQASPAVMVTVQLDWTAWSSFESLDVTFPGELPALAQHFDLDWSDTLAVRFGVQYTASPRLVIRGGALFDGNAVPDRTIERQYLDANKFGAALGAAIGLSRSVTLDVTASAIGGPPREVPVVTVEEWPQQSNIAPGEHDGQVLTLSTGVRIGL